MTLEELQALEQKATSLPWTARDDAKFVEVLCNLAPELLELWKAANEQAYDHGSPSMDSSEVITDCRCTLCEATNALNLKVQEL